MLTVPRRGVGHSANALLLDDSLFSELPVNHIGCLNWPDEFPYRPDVSFRLFHNDAYLFIGYDVREKCTAALETVDGNDVYMDSCVEFFILPDGGDHYYNFEWNAIGTLCMSRRTGRFDPVHAPKEVLSSVLTSSTYGRKAFSEIKGDNLWQLRAAIPCSALFGDALESWKGAKFSANFYKCGDGLSTPHYVTWAPVGTPSPDYHRPEFFLPAICE